MNPYERSEADYMRWNSNVRNFENFAFNIARYFKSHEVFIDVPGILNTRECVFRGKLKGGRFHGIAEIMKLAPNNCKVVFEVNKSGTHKTYWSDVTIVMHEEQWFDRY